MSRKRFTGVDPVRWLESGARDVKAWASGSVGTGAAVVGIVIVWEAVTQLHIQNNAYLPSFSFAVQQSIANVDALIDGIRQTFGAVVTALPLAVFFGIVLGVILAESFVARQTSMPILVFTYSIPHAILAPMFLIWFGLGLPGIVAFAIWIAFFPTFINTLTSMSTVYPEMEKLAAITGATRWQRVRYLKFWRALPDIISGIRISVQMTIVGVIVAEFLAGGVGLGHLIQHSTYAGRLGLTFGGVITIGVGAILLFKLVSTGLARLDPSHRVSHE